VSDSPQRDGGTAGSPASGTQAIEGLLQTSVQHKSDWSNERPGRRARRKRRLELMSSEELSTEGKRHDLRLRKRVGAFALVGVSAELIIANAVFVAYAWAGERWKVPTAAINVWLGATVVQVTGILYVITNYLFPKSGTPLSHDE
jgi:hypothetical protein